MKNNVVITGANRGIGLALVKQFERNGDNIFALCRKSSPELDVLRSNTSVNVIENIDVTADDSLMALPQLLSGLSIDVLICNAGILRDETLTHLNVDTIREQFEVNAIAPIRIVSALEGQLSTQGKIAMITSRMGSIADNTSGGRYGYRMSKAALNIASMSLAHDLAHKNIAVGIYHPGYVQTDMVNHGGDISADVAAKRITQLISELTMKESGVFKHSNGETLPW